MEELPGHIGPYEVRDRLGHGGMGVVFLGYDPMLDRPVAIKVLKVPDEETRRRFLREARLAARVHHPHIVSIYAVGEHEGNPYLAMEFIAGRTMAQVIRSGDQIPLARKVHWLSELCAGLAHAHQSGIVHRDVKPSNLLIAQGSNALRLLDFGIAHGNEVSGMTMAGMIVGTPQYMSPEQITGQPVDARSDIFSVGAVAYELLTGRQAFAGDNLYQVSRLVVGEQPHPLGSAVPNAPPRLVETIQRCLQKDVAARPQDARLLEKEFRSIARRLDPDQTLVAVAEPQPTVVAAGKDLTTSRRELLREAQDAIDQGQFTTASGLLQRLEASNPSLDVQQLRQKLQRGRQELRVQDALARAEESLHSGTLEECEQAIATLAEIAPRHPDLERLRSELQSRLDDRQVAGLASRARSALQQGRLDEAEALVAEALALAPDNPQALSVQQKLQDRVRAQRIARLVAQASRALDQDDVAAARKAIDALMKIDASHRDVDRLLGRLQALTADDQGAVSGPLRPAIVSVITTGRDPQVAGPDASDDVMAAPAAAHATAAAVPAVGVETPPPQPAPGTGHHRMASPTPKPASAPLTPPPIEAARLDPPSGGTKTVAAPVQPAASADGLLLREAGHASPTTEARPVGVAPAESDLEPSPGRAWLLPAVAALLLLLAIAGWFFARRGTPPLVTAAGPAAAAASGAATDAPPVTISPTSTTSTAPTEPAAPDTVPPAAPPAAAAVASDPWAAVRRETAAGRFDRALTAIDQVQGVPAALLQEERARVVENARRQTLAARRGAEDMRLTTTPQFAEGTARQAQADSQRTAGRFKGAVAAYMTSRSHFLRAFTDSGKAAPTAAVTAPVVEPPAPPVAAPAAAQAPTAAPNAPRVDLSTWSNDEAHATIAQFCGAYLSRDLGGLNRLWPNMGPEWRNELREAFGTTGELVCVFENVTIVRTSDEFSASARLLTQLPGGDQRRRRLALSLVPARDRLVIGNISVR